MQGHQNGNSFDVSKELSLNGWKMYGFSMEILENMELSFAGNKEILNCINSIERIKEEKVSNNAKKPFYFHLIN